MPAGKGKSALVYINCIPEQAPYSEVFGQYQMDSRVLLFGHFSIFLGFCFVQILLFGVSFFVCFCFVTLGRVERERAQNWVSNEALGAGKEYDQIIILCKTFSKSEKSSQCLAIPFSFISVLTRITLLIIVWCSFPKIFVCILNEK